jgi:hypothetical protein
LCPFDLLVGKDRAPRHRSVISPYCFRGAVVVDTGLRCKLFAEEWSQGFIQLGCFDFIHGPSPLIAKIASRETNRKNTICVFFGAIGFVPIL